MARIQLARNDLSAALKTIDEAIAFDPHDANYYATRAMIQAGWKNWKQALNDCSAALELDPENLKAINVRSYAQRVQGNTQGATTELRQALEVDPDDPYSHANLGWARLQRGELIRRKRIFARHYGLTPS